MVFFDWDRSNLSSQAQNTIQQAANAFKTTGSARVTATGHADTIRSRKTTTWRCRCAARTP